MAAPTVGAPWAWVGQLGAGTYAVEVHAATVSPGDYRLRIERLDPFAVTIDQEPNDTVARARPLPPSRQISGTRDSDGDIDWYRLGSLDVPTPVVLTLDGAPGSVVISDGARTFPAVADASGRHLRTVLLPAGVPLYLEITPGGAYGVHVDSGIPAGTGPRIPAFAIEADTSMTMSQTTVAADWTTPQRLSGVLTIGNEEPSGGPLTLDYVASAPGWTVVIDQPQVDLPGYGTIEVPFQIDVPPRARADVPVRTTIRARAVSGAQVTGFVDITPELGAAPAEP